MHDHLNLVGHLFARGRKLEKVGAKALALQTFQQLSRFRHLPTSTHTRTHEQLSKLYSQNKRYRRARRHLVTSLIQRPDDAKLHFRMAQLIAKDVFCDPKRAARHFKRALKLDPKNPTYLSVYGWFAVKHDRPKTGLRSLREAFAIAPSNGKVVTRYVKGLQKLGRVSEARRVLQTSRFQNVGSVWFQRLVSDFEFFVLAKKQEAERRRDVAPVEPLCILPFPAREASDASNEEIPDTYRLDRAAVLRAPHLSAMKRHPDQRHAQ